MTGCSAGYRTSTQSSSARIVRAAITAASVLAQPLREKLSLTGFSMHCEATWSGIPQLTQNCTPEMLSAAYSAGWLRPECGLDLD